MSPLFTCSGCGVQIERSVQLYRQQKGRLLCSSCKDRLEADRPRSEPPSEPPSEPRSEPRDEAAGPEPPTRS